jgi:hypothetical protein
MKTQLKQQIASLVLGVAAAAGLIAFGFQNCAQMKFSVDEDRKAATIANGNVLGGNDTGIDPTVGGDNPTGIDPTTGGENPNNPGNPTGIDPTVPRGNPPGSTPPYQSINIELACPMGVQAHGAAKSLLSVTGDVKVVIEGLDVIKQTKSVLCEVHNVKQQILSKHSVDMSICKSYPTSTYIMNLYIVEESVTNNYDKYRVNVNPTSFSGFNSGVTYPIAYTEMNDTTNRAGCSLVGDPLLVQLREKPEIVKLTAPENGVMFDLLGRQVNHQKVQVSWFVSGETENYFLVLPNKNGQVLGIDEMFGDTTFGPDHKYAKQGFESLAKYDDDNDLIITRDDEVFSKLRLWKDRNLDGAVQYSELYTLEEKQVIAIDLRYDPRYQEKDKYGNITKYKSIVIMKDKSYGLVFDLWLRYNPK